MPSTDRAVVGLQKKGAVLWGVYKLLSLRPFLWTILLGTMAVLASPDGANGETEQSDSKQKSLCSGTNLSEQIAIRLSSLGFDYQGPVRVLECKDDMTAREIEMVDKERGTDYYQRWSRDLKEPQVHHYYFSFARPKKLIDEKTLETEQMGYSAFLGHFLMALNGSVSAKEESIEKALAPYFASANRVGMLIQIIPSEFDNSKYVHIPIETLSECLQKDSVESMGTCAMN